MVLADFEIVPFYLHAILYPVYKQTASAKLPYANSAQKFQLSHCKRSKQKISKFFFSNDFIDNQSTNQLINDQYQDRWLVLLIPANRFRVVVVQELLNDNGDDLI